MLQDIAVFTLKDMQELLNEIFDLKHEMLGQSSQIEILQFENDLYKKLLHQYNQRPLQFSRVGAYDEK